MTQNRNAVVFAPEDIATDRIAEPQARALSWYPRLMTEGAHLALAPAMFWLAASLRPDHTVALGLGNGHLFFSVAQALDKLGADGRVTGIVGPKEDKDDIAALSAHLRQLYQDIAQLVPATQAAPSVDPLTPAGIDLLIVDPATAGPLSPDDIAAWIARVNPHGVVAVAGVPSDEDSAAPLRLAMSDWNTRHIAVGPGLALFQRDGEILNAPILSSAGQSVLRRFGEGLEAIAARDATQSALSMHDARLKSVETALTVAEDNFSQLQRAHEAQFRKRADLESALFDQQIESRTLAERAAALTATAEHSQAATDRLNREIQRLQTQSLDYKASIEKHVAERLTLTRVAEEMRAEIQRLQTQAQTQTQDDKARAEAQAKEMRAEIGRLQAQSKDENTKAEAQAAELRAEIGRLQAQSQDDKATIAKQAADNATLKASLKRTKEKLRAENQRAEALQSRLSWRLTAPIRAARSVFR